jgi:uncharacterized protein YndB with AHSA1/START domain
MKKMIVVTRVINSPVEKVWEAWTNPELVMRWWGPDKFTCPNAKIDFREGGVSLVTMRAPKEFGGLDFYNTWAYTKIVPMVSIEYIQNLSDKVGNKTNPVSWGMPSDFPEDVQAVVKFKELSDNKTEITVTEFGDFGQMFHSATIGLEQCLDKMVAIFDTTK